MTSVECELFGGAMRALRAANQITVAPPKCRAYSPGANAPVARIVAMKKPKKTAIAKPLSKRTRGRTKTGAGISKKPKAAAKKAIAKKTRKAAPKKSTASTKPKVSAAKKRVPKQKITAATKAIDEPKIAVTPIVAKKTSATAKSAPKPPLFDLKPLSVVKPGARGMASSDLKFETLPKILPKPKVKASEAAAPKLKPEPPEIPAEEKPEMAVELIFEKKKAPPKPRVKTKRAVKSLAKIVASPAPVEKKVSVETKAAVEKPVAAVRSTETKQSSRPARKAPANIPPILLEGDKPEPISVGGPGHRYALGPKAPVEKLQTEGELPESYGTGTILLAARDPHWLYTHWDLSGDQQRRYNGFSRDGHLIVRIYIDAARGKPVAQVHVHPDSRHWFVHVDRANTRYVAELGYYSAADKWKAVATSDSTVTPPDAVSKDTTAEFGTMPAEVPMEKLVALVKEAAQESAPLAQAIEQLREQGHSELPRIQVLGLATATGSNHVQSPWQDQTHAPVSAVPKGNASRPRWTPSKWTAAQERALAEVISMDHVRRVWMGSMEITELIRRQYVNELASMAAAEIIELTPGAPTSPAGALGGISSPAAKPGAQEKGFWFNVNAELIVYGATEPDATVSIAGRKIKLRPDGSFSYRFALPDGNYEMPVVAISADGTDGRAAELKFSRGTEIRGDVGAHPQDSSLQPLMAENF